MTHRKTSFLEYWGCRTRQPGRTWLIGPGAVLALIQNAGFVRDNSTESTKGGHRGRKPASKKLLGRRGRVLYLWHGPFICVTWLIHLCDVNRSYAWHDSFVCVTWLINHSYACHDSFICVTWLFHMCAMTHSYVWHGSFIRVTKSLSQTHADSTCDLESLNSCVWHAAVICVTCLIHM